MIYSLSVTAKMNDVDPQAWLADVLSRIAEHSALRLDEFSQITRLIPPRARPSSAIPPYPPPSA
jgi:IS66 C-terminal element